MAQKQSRNKRKRYFFHNFPTILQQGPYTSLYVHIATLTVAIYLCAHITLQVAILQFGAVTFPFHYAKTVSQRFCAKLAIAIWAVSLVLWVPSLYLTWRVGMPAQKFLQENDPSYIAWLRSYTVINTVGLLLFITAVTLVYAVTTRKIRHRHHQSTSVTRSFRLLRVQVMSFFTRYIYSRKHSLFVPPTVRANNQQNLSVDCGVFSSDEIYNSDTNWNFLKKMYTLQCNLFI